MDKTDTNFELQYKIIYKIDYYQNMKLADLITGLQGIENEYKFFCTKEAKKSKTKKDIIKFDKVLEINEINKGSIEFELINSVSPLFSDLNTLYNFGCLLKQAYDYLIEPTAHTLPDVGKKTWNNIKKTLEPIVSIPGTINLNLVFGSGNTINILNTDSKQSNAMQNRANKLIEEQTINDEMTDENIGIYMYWDMAGFFRTEEHANKKVGKIFIETIDSDKAYQVRFIKEEDRIFCMTRDTKYISDWQDLMYKVDVNVIKKQSKIIAYEVVDIYRNATLEIQE